MIVTGAENVYPAEVENALFGHPAIADVAVIGVPDEKWGEAVKAVVVLKPGMAATAEDLVGLCAQIHRRLQIAEDRSISWRPCRAIRPARSRAANCARPIGKAETARSPDEPMTEHADIYPILLAAPV